MISEQNSKWVLSMQTVRSIHSDDETIWEENKSWEI